MAEMGLKRRVGIHQARSGAIMGRQGQKLDKKDTHGGQDQPIVDTHWGAGWEVDSLQGRLEMPEKDLNSPALGIELGYALGIEVPVTGQEAEGLAPCGVFINDAAED